MTSRLLTESSVESPPRQPSWRGWTLYALAWLLLAVFWALAGAGSSDMSPRETLPFGVIVMGTAGVMGVGVWWLTGRLAWEPGSRIAFYATHAFCLLAFALVYTASSLVADGLHGLLAAFVTSPVSGWGILMGSWLYLIVAGWSYNIRAVRRLRAQTAAAAQARLLATEAQLTALRARLNPHFLFNALHSVSALVSVDPEAADEAIDRLGGLLRYALVEGTADVTLEQEWAFTRDYLAFEALRLGDRLRTTIDLTPDALRAVVPVFVLQPLVENAVRHGLAAGAGTVAIAARLDGPRLVLRVSDDGPGAGSAETDGSGLGLGLLRQRLAARYGPDASLTVESAPGTGFAVTLTLPATGELA